MSINKGQPIREALQKYDKAKQEEGADLCRECELPSKTRELEEAIEGLIKAVNESNFCSTCSEEFGNLACSECPWHQAKVRAIRLLAKEEESE